MNTLQCIHFIAVLLASLALVVMMVAACLWICRRTFHVEHSTIIEGVDIQAANLLPDEWLAFQQLLEEGGDITLERFTKQMIKNQKS